MSRRRAVSLLEVLVASFLMALVVGLTALLAQSYSSVARKGRDREAVVQAAQLALAQVTEEAREAIQIQTYGSTFTFQKVAPQVARLPVSYPSPVPTPLGATWQPWAAASLVNVTYRLTPESKLVRRVWGPSVTPPTESVVCQEVYGFDASDSGQGLLTFRLGLRVDSSIQTLVGEVFRAVP